LGDDSPPLVVDVRGRDEFTGPLGHLQGARNIPLDELAGRMSELSAFRDRQIVLVCRTQMRSAKAAAALTAAEFGKVSVLRGGMEQWNREGLALDGRST
jgi:rhodanese-related sulfurtransferase